MDSPARGSVASLTVTVSLGVAIFFTLYSLIPVTRSDVPGLSSMFIGTMMTFVMAVQVFTPALVRRFSLRTVLAAAVALLAAGALATGWSTGALLLLAGAVSGGAGFGTLIVAGAHGVALLVPARRLGRALGAYGLVSMTAAAVGSPAGVQLALAFSPRVFGVCALLLGALAVILAFGIPAEVGRDPHKASVVRGGGHEQSSHAATRQPGRLRKLLVEAPWLVLSFLLLGVMLLSHGLSSLPVLGTVHVGAAVIVFAVQAGNALGRGAGGELDARAGAGVTVAVAAGLLAAGGVVGVLLDGAAAMIVSGALVGLGVGVAQTVTLHMTMRRMDAGRASVIWNLAVDGGLWVGGIVWGIALTSGLVHGGVLLVSAGIVVVGVVIVMQLKGPAVPDPRTAGRRGARRGRRSVIRRAARGR